MFCAFEGPARIVRLSGTATVVTCDDAEFAELAACFASHPGARAIVTVELDRVADSCGYGVPRMTLVGQRDLLHSWATARSDDELREYRAEKNRSSIDGLRGL
jgi:hypothetical protein